MLGRDLICGVGISCCVLWERVGRLERVVEHYAQYMVILCPRGTIKNGEKEDATVASGMPCTIHTVGTGGGEEAGKKEHDFTRGHGQRCWRF